MAGLQAGSLRLDEVNVRRLYLVQVGVLAEQVQLSKTKVGIGSLACLLAPSNRARTVVEVVS